MNPLRCACLSAMVPILSLALSTGCSSSPSGGSSSTGAGPTNGGRQGTTGSGPSSSGASGTSGAGRTSGTSGAAGSSSSGGSTSAGTSGSGGGSTGGGVWQPYPTVAACANPTISAGFTLSPNSTPVFEAPEIAWNGSSAAVVYTQSATGGYTVELQAIDGSGHAVGSPVQLAAVTTTAGQFAQLTAIAPSGNGFIACWDTAPGITCAAIPATGTPVNGLTLASGVSAPSLAAGAGGVWLAYDSGGTTLEVQPLDATANASGTPWTQSLTISAQIAVAPTPNGYAIGVPTQNAQDTYNETLSLYSPAGSLLSPGWTSITNASRAPSIAALGSNLLVTFQDLSGQAADAVLETTAGAGSEVALSASTDSTYGNTAVAAGVDSYATIWSGVEYLSYQALDATGAAVGSQVQVVNQNWDDNPLSIVAVTDGFLVAAVLGEGNGTVEVLHLGCP